MRALLVVAAALVPPISAAQVPADAPPSSAGPAAPSPSPRAGEDAGPVSLFASAGWARATHDDLGASGFESAPAFEAGVAVRLVPHVAVQASAAHLGFGDRRSSLRRTGSDPAAPVEQLDIDRKLTVVPLLAEVRVSAGWRALEAFGRAGAGVSLASWDATARSSISGSSSSSDSDASLALHLGAGLSAALSARVSVGVEASYLATKATFFASAVRMEAIVLAGALSYRP